MFISFHCPTQRQVPPVLKSNFGLWHLINIVFISWNHYFFLILQGERYGPMLTAQGGDKILLKLLDEKVESPENMKSLIREIISELENSNGYKVDEV